MNIEIKNVKYAAFASEETNCFSATVYIDGKKAGEVSNDGRGGCNEYAPWSIADTLNTHAKTLPIIVTDIADKDSKSGFFEYEQDADAVIDELFSAWLCSRDLKKLLSNRLLYTKKGKDGLFQSNIAKPANVQVWLRTPAKIVDKLGVEILLNVLPFESALEIYRQRTS